MSVSQRLERGLLRGENGAGGVAREHVGPFAADTIPANITTTEVITAPGTRSSTIDTIGDFDFFRITLTAGYTYTFALNSVGGSFGLNDPSLALYNSTGTLITLDDDSGPGFNALITYTAPTSGDYYLGANGIPTSTGDYNLVAAIVGLPDTIPGGVTTTSTLVMDGPSQVGNVDFSGDEDWFAVTLVAGESYSFTLDGTGASPLGDPFLRLYNSAGTLVSIDDDGGDGLDAMMQFTAVTSGTYYLSAGAVTGAGEYTIAAAHGPAQDPMDTLDLGFTFETTNIQVYFALQGQNLGPEGPATRSFAASEQTQVMAALATIANVANLTFSITTVQAEAEFILSLDNLPAGLLGVTYPTPSSGYIVFGQNAPGWTTSGLQPGGLGFSVVIHEAAHALGLAHPHYDGGDTQIMQGVLSEFGSYGTFGLNQQVFTIMSYNDGYTGPNGMWQTTTSDNFGYSATPMALDIAYLQQLYGATTHNTGNTTYQLGASNAANPYYQTIWDTGGTDTIRANLVDGAYIDLNPATLLNAGGGGGFVSYTYAASVLGGFTIANGVVIENAIGGLSNDTLIGNDANNVLTGDFGADILRGNAGNDTLNGGAMSDRLDGGTGVDTMTGGSSDDQYVVDDVGDVVFELANEGVDRVETTLTTYTLGFNVENLWLMAGALDGVGNELDNSIVGNELANTISGGDGADTLRGGAGDDTITGGAGADTAIDEAGSDNIDLGIGNDVLRVSHLTSGASETNTYLGGDGTDLLSFIGSNQALTINLALGTVTSATATDTFTGFESVAGGSGADNIIGSDGDDRLFGGSGQDVVNGGAGVDTLDVTLDADASGTVDLLTGVADFGGQTDTLSNIENVYGSSGSDTFRGDNGANRLEGNGFSDWLEGRGGDDVLLGGDGDDIVNGGAGADVLNGGLGYDRVSYAGASGGVTVNLHLQTASGGDADGDTLVSFEAAIGSSFDDVFLVSTALTHIDGGQGTDIVSFTYAAQAVSANFSTNTFTTGGVTYLLTNVEGIIGTAFADTIVGGIALYGAGGDDTLTAFFGNNYLDGGAGADQMSGSHDDDTYVVDNVGDVVAELEGQGTDTVRSHLADYTLLANFENLILGAGALFGVGNAANNVITGNSENNILDGAAGADVMIGGDGDDTYAVDNAGDVTSETSALGGVDTVQSQLTRTLGANLENLVLVGAAATSGFGNALNNQITGNGAANQLNGFDGADILDGGAGADNMFGGNGDDTYYVDNAGDQTTEVSALGGTDTVYSSVGRNLTANIENLTLTGNANITGSGNAINNIIVGNAGVNTLYGFDGDDRLDGGAGADTLFGANGDDTYVVDDAGDITVEGSALGGVDTVETYISRNLNANFENMTLLGSATIAYGNVINNVLTGNVLVNALYGFDGNDTLDGGIGADNMFGGNGDDTYYVNEAGDVTSEASALGGVDTVISSVSRNLNANIENLTLTGDGSITGAGNILNNIIIGNGVTNTLYGLDGNDRLDGGLGADTLQGGAGADEYVFSTTLGGGNVDAIVGFNVADDTIVLNNAVFTGLATGALAASAFVIGTAAADADDRIIYNSATGQLFFDADGSEAGAAVLFATLSAGLSLTSADFIVGGP